jgi:hypothetical protein
LVGATAGASACAATDSDALEHANSAHPTITILWHRFMIYLYEQSLAARHTSAFASSTRTLSARNGFAQFFAPTSGRHCSALRAKPAAHGGMRPLRASAGAGHAQL